MARKKVTWLGNKHKREFHRIVEGEKHPAECHLDLVKQQHKVPSRTARVLRDSGFDAAKFCNKRFKSRENT